MTVPGQLTILPGLVVERRRIGRVLSVDVHCSSCGERLACGTDTAEVLRLAATNVVDRPCCTAWET